VWQNQQLPDSISNNKQIKEFMSFSGDIYVKNTGC
jgi:hypothetical protein